MRSLNPIPRLPSPERRCNVSTARALWRIGLSLGIRRWTPSPVVPVELGGFLAEADLRTPIGLALYRYGFCAPEARVCATLLRPGDVFVDGGANLGLFALRGATVVGSSGRVLACEPGPGTMKLLRANVRRNRFATVELHESALSDEVGRASFTVFEPGSGVASFAPGSESGDTVEVDVTTLDDLTAGFDDRVAVVKLDVEGAEVRALAGASNLISRAAPHFLVEVEPAHLARQGASVDDLMALLVPHGYEAYAIESGSHLVKLEGRWLPPNAARPNLVLASPSRSGRLRGLVRRPATDS